MAETLTGIETGSMGDNLTTNDAIEWLKPLQGLKRVIQLRTVNNPVAIEWLKPLQGLKLR